MTKLSFKVIWLLNRLALAIQLLRLWRNCCQNLQTMIWQASVHGQIMWGLSILGHLLCTLLILLTLFAVTRTKVRSFLPLLSWLQLLAICGDIVLTTNFLLKHSGDCVDHKTGLEGRCVVGAITNYTDQLLSYGSDTESKCKSSFALQHYFMFFICYIYLVYRLINSCLDMVTSL